MTDALEERFRSLVLNESDSSGDAGDALVAADYFLERNNMRLAASAYDRAWGLNPHDESIQRLRGDLLNELAIEEHGIHFRYVPAGSFQMGSSDGDADEQPVHPVPLDDFWMADIPVTWAAYAQLMEYEPPPGAFPADDSAERMQLFRLNEKNKIRLQYCETETQQAGDWHAHTPDQQWKSGGRTVTAEELFGRVPRNDAGRPFEYNVKPMVAVSVQEAEELCEKISTAQVSYHLPSEAQWEKAARGGLIGKRYAWGDKPPDSSCCDFGHFGDWVIRNPLETAPNGYGLHAMCGGVWEWTQDHYDTAAYLLPLDERWQPPEPEPQTSLARFLRFVRRSGPVDGEAPERVLRGGSWADCEDAVTVSFRMSRMSSHWREESWCAAESPTIGFRICRTEHEV